MTVLFVSLVLLVLGYFWSGIAIASLHCYAHKAKLWKCRHHGPRSAAIYRAYHLAHHSLIQNEMETRRHKLSTREWVGKLWWAFGFALTNARWMALRTLYMGVGMMVFVVLTISMLVGICSPAMVIFGASTFLAGAFICLIAYDLCHSWTHAGGPFPSTLHSAHHARPSANYGMWQWHNWVDIKATRCTIWMLQCAEGVAIFIPPLRRRLDEALIEATSN
jgi:hypothetical protein